jgi:hypothetical protein
MAHALAYMNVYRVLHDISRIQPALYLPRRMQLGNLSKWSGFWSEPFSLTQPEHRVNKALRIPDPKHRSRKPLIDQGFSSSSLAALRL